MRGAEHGGKGGERRIGRAEPGSGVMWRMTLARGDVSGWAVAMATGKEQEEEQAQAAGGCPVLGEMELGVTAAEGQGRTRQPWKHRTIESFESGT